MSLGRNSFYKINENKSKRKINIDLAIVASQIPGGAIHDNRVGAIDVSRPVTREGTDGSVGPETWEHTRSRGREGRVSIFVFLIES